MKKALLFLIILEVFMIQSALSQSSYRNCRSLFEGKIDNCESSYNFYTGYSYTSGLVGLEWADEKATARVGLVLYSMPITSTESLSTEQFNVVGLSLGGDGFLLTDKRNNPYIGTTLVVCDQSYMALNFGYRFVSRNTLLQFKIGSSIMIIDWLMVPAADLTMGIRLR